jgi:hypothetical protein
MTLNNSWKIWPNFSTRSVIQQSSFNKDGIFCGEVFQYGVALKNGSKQQLPGIQMSSYHGNTVLIHEVKKKKIIHKI